MKIYLVGGAVRDKLLNLPIKERDYVVVGASAEEMHALGYRQVGKEFPVFLHPKTHEEYALARMERKVSAGYQGFSFDTSATVRLEEDLIRRDLTINAMAYDEEENRLIDPFQGHADLQAKMLRHVSHAFKEDPVRILRLARFLARFTHQGFKVAAETMQLMQEMTAQGEVNALVPERVWKEWERALKEKNPEQFFILLDQCHALAILFPELNINDPGLAALARSTAYSDDSTVRFAVLVHALPEAAIRSLCDRYHLPRVYKELGLLTAGYYQKAIEIAEKPDAESLMFLFDRLDIFRRNVRFQKFLTACKVIAPPRAKPKKSLFTYLSLNNAHKSLKFNAKKLEEAAHVAMSVNIQDLLKQQLSGPEMAEKIKKLRKQKLIEWLEDDQSIGRVRII
jgi:tRNA nucleotidyltransferase (CCA-adding enzyme)